MDPIISTCLKFSTHQYLSLVPRCSIIQEAFLSEWEGPGYETNLYLCSFASLDSPGTFKLGGMVGSIRKLTNYNDQLKSYRCISKLCQEVADTVEVDHLLQMLQLFGIPWHKYPQ